MDDYIPLHICDDLLPEDIPYNELQNRLVIKKMVENEEVFTGIRNPNNLYRS